jgi:hypothetical protein
MKKDGLLNDGLVSKGENELQNILPQVVTLDRIFTYLAPREINILLDFTPG